MDPHAENIRRFSTYNYGENNPIKMIDPDGMDATSDFKDKAGKLISHVADGSNAVYQLTGTDQTNEFFKFTGYSDQGGTNTVNQAGAIAGAQDYVTNNYTECNQSVNFVGRTYESATAEEGKTVDNIGIVSKNELAHPITKDLKANATAEPSIAAAQKSAGEGNLVVGAKGPHVVTMTTQTFTITHYGASGAVTQQKQIPGGLTTNVNGSYKPTNIGPAQTNSFQNPTYSGMTWYSLPAQ